MNFLHTFNPNPIFLEIDFLKIHWYGLIIGLTTLLALFIAEKLNNKYKNKNIIIFKDKDQMIDLCFYLVIFVLLGARIYAVLLFLPYYLTNPLDIFKVWEGGLAIHGGIIAGIITIFYYTKKHQIDLAYTFDLIAPVSALGQAIGRWGNYFNQELFGLPTSLPWGIPIAEINRPEVYQNSQYFHPTFLYESVLNITLALILFWLHKNRLKKLANTHNLASFASPPVLGGVRGGNGEQTNLDFQKTEREIAQHGNHEQSQNLSLTKNQKGDIFLYYLMGYSLIRFSLEFIKIDPTPLFYNLRWPQVTSLVIITLAVLILWYKKSGNPKKTTT
jgi:phosphatidylglycerol:prolipoprotein diacylglycerol transferase